MEQVILVDQNDNEIGLMEKLEAHRKGLLHRAFSVLIFNSQGEILLQKRANDKYHSAGLWTNTCCSHPQPNEDIGAASKRRLMEEMGIVAQPFFAFKFKYKIDLGQGLTEHEFDHVYLGIYDGEPQLNENEASDWKFMNVNELKSEISEKPQLFTYWFKLIMFHPELNTEILAS